ncbi:MAG: hypothetical protein K2P17_00275 [Helicobacteraceae bacterium]|nr:hypothetical protein [Helicobacteraceae bacterium]
MLNNESNLTNITQNSIVENLNIILQLLSHIIRKPRDINIININKRIIAITDKNAIKSLLSQDFKPNNHQ